ncbi:MAG: methionine synthase, partial [Acetobacter sp.]|nr:methionine synthase [Acetobacter sp.]
ASPDGSIVGRVAYARDAFDGLTLMDHITSGRFDTYLAAVQKQRGEKKTRQYKAQPERGFAPVDNEKARARRQRITADEPAITPPFWGKRVLEATPEAVIPFLNERSLYQFQWGFRKQGRSLEAFLEWARQELRPVLKRMLTLCQEQNILHPQAVYGYWKAAGDGNDLILFDPDGRTEITRFTLPRQPRENGECLADFVPDITEPSRGVIALQAVTIGQKASDIARQWFEENRYQDYLYLHGLSVEIAEAMAEYTHRRIRAECGFAAEDARETEKLLQQGYRGARYSFGYPACPKMEDQSKILTLLQANQIGVSLTEGDQLYPEQSTSALVMFNKHARYFTI